MKEGKGLLHEALEAHGGLERWKEANEISFNASTGGIALPLKLQFSAFRNYHGNVSTDPKFAYSAFTPYYKDGLQGVFQNGSVRILAKGGTVFAERTNPRAELKELRQQFMWDPLDTLYFGGYAMWNYMNLPFLLTAPGIELFEIEPWQEGSQKLRRLHAVFPAQFHTHSKEQTFYFSEEGLLVRHDYTAEAFGSWAKVAHYSVGHKEFDGLKFATIRRVFPRMPDNTPLKFITLVSIDIEDIKIK
jgi:hypothetical protein